MSRLSEMIQELCPDGVEYRKLGETVSICRGIRVVRAELQSEGEYPVYQNSLIPMATMINRIAAVEHHLLSEQVRRERLDIVK